MLTLTNLDTGYTVEVDDPEAAIREECARNAAIAAKNAASDVTPMTAYNGRGEYLWPRG